MPWEHIIAQKAWIDSFAFIPHANVKAPLTIAELHFDTLRFAMAECVSQGFPRDPIYLIVYEGLQSSRRALDV
jgi:hypothetical protein